MSNHHGHPVFVRCRVTYLNGRWIWITICRQAINHEGPAVRRCYKVEHNSDERKHGEELSDPRVGPHHVKPHLLGAVATQPRHTSVGQDAAKVAALGGNSIENILDLSFGLKKQLEITIWLL